ncbi:Snx3, partial [Symbiodinium pilosum]
VDGVMWYNLEVTNESGRSWMVQRRYNDFAHLDEELKKSRSLEVPTLPGKEALNPLKVFDRDGFADKRMEGLKSYLSGLAAQVQTMAQDQVLEQFLQVDLSTRAEPGEEEPEPTS